MMEVRTVYIYTTSCLYMCVRIGKLDILIVVAGNTASPPAGERDC